MKRARGGERRARGKSGKRESRKLKLRAKGEGGWFRLCGEEPSPPGAAAFGLRLTQPQRVAASATNGICLPSPPPPATALRVSQPALRLGLHP
jgi:hypothetical protein